MAHSWQTQSSTSDAPAPTGPPLDRRSYLGWVVNGLGGLFAAGLSVPLVAYVLDPRNRAAAVAAFKPVAKLDDLTVGVPREYVIREQRRDAWTLHPNEIVGRVFLIRQPDNKVVAFTTICPHLGCSVNYTGTTQGTCFLCPCHGGRFEVTGARIEPEHNPAPRNMDSLDTEVRPDGWVHVAYKTFYQGRPDKEERK